VRAERRNRSLGQLSAARAAQVPRLAGSGYVAAVGRRGGATESGAVGLR